MNFSQGLRNLPAIEVFFFFLNFKKYLYMGQTMTNLNKAQKVKTWPPVDKLVGISKAKQLQGKPETTKNLSAIERRFVEEYVLNDGRKTLTQMLLDAGYSEAQARSMKGRVLDPIVRPHVVAAIRDRQEEINRMYGVSVEKHLKELAAIRERALQENQLNTALQAEYRRGQVGGLYIDRKEIRHGTIDSMSKEEVMRELESLKKQNLITGEVIDVETRDEVLAEAEGEDAALDQGDQDRDDGEPGLSGSGDADGGQDGEVYPGGTEDGEEPESGDKATSG